LAAKYNTVILDWRQQFAQRHS